MTEFLEFKHSRWVKSRGFWLCLALVLPLISPTGVLAVLPQGVNETVARPAQNEQVLDSFIVDLNAGPESQTLRDQQPMILSESTVSPWSEGVRIGYDDGFVLASPEVNDLKLGDSPFQLKINGWGQLRQTVLDSKSSNPDLNQFQLQRARVIASGSVFTPDFSYYIQVDGRSSSGDNLRLLDYYLTYDMGHHRFGWEEGRFGLKTGKYKMPFSLSRWLSGRELEFADRSVASTFFDVNRSLAWGIYGRTRSARLPINWEVALFNGLVTGGAETGSSGTLDNNFAYSGRVYCYPHGVWGESQLADFEWHNQIATRMGAAVANTTVTRSGTTEFNSFRVIDSGNPLVSLLPIAVNEYNVNMFAIDASCKYRGWSANSEYYFRSVSGFQGGSVPDLFDHGFWLQAGKFVVPERLELLTRWSRTVGNSGTLGGADQSSDEVSGGFVWYFRGQHAKFTFDATWLDGAPISSSALNVSPGDEGLLFRSQFQFAF